MVTTNSGHNSLSTLVLCVRFIAGSRLIRFFLPQRLQLRSCSALGQCWPTALAACEGDQPVGQHRLSVFSRVIVLAAVRAPAELSHVIGEVA